MRKLEVFSRYDMVEFAFIVNFLLLLSSKAPVFILMLKKESYILNQHFLSFQYGEEKGFDFFFRAYYKPLCFFANKYTRDMPAAEDVVSEVFIKVWEKRETITSAEGLKSYLYKSVYHGCLRWKGRESRVGSLKSGVSEWSIVNSEFERSYLDNMIRAEVMDEVYRAIELLPKECQKIFTKLFLEGKTVKEIAEELSLSVSTVKTQKARAINFLRSKLSTMSVVMFVTFIS